MYQHLYRITPLNPVLVLPHALTDNPNLVRVL